MTDPKDIQIAKPHPLMATLPVHLKDPANYEKVQKTIIEALAGKHSHGEVLEWASCSDCQSNFRNRGKVLKAFGFTSPAQYMAWRQIHHTIKQMKRVKNPKYNT